MKVRKGDGWIHIVLYDGYLLFNLSHAIKYPTIAHVSPNIYYILMFVTYVFTLVF